MLSIIQEAIRKGYVLSFIDYHTYQGYKLFDPRVFNEEYIYYIAIFMNEIYDKCLEYLDQASNKINSSTHPTTLGT